jgi:uncharacterized protein involved in exopolysaccharide biosynthesis
LQDEQISVLALGTVLLRHRVRILRWILLGGVVAALTVLWRPQLYSARLSFVPQGNDIARSGLASLAGQLGLTTPVGNLSQSPEFYVGLIKSRELLRPIVHDTIVVAEMQGKRMPFVELSEVRGSTARREELAIERLSKAITASVGRNTGVVHVRVLTKWPSVSLAVASGVLNRVNDFNLKTRQSQAASERRFVEGRLSIARSELRASEDRLQAFLSSNRAIGSSPQLTFERDRLQRDVNLQQQVFTTLAQAYDDVRIREVRDTPTITIVESPAVSTIAEPRGRLKRGVLGLVIGALFGASLVLLGAAMHRREVAGDPDARMFLDTVTDVKRSLFGRFQRKA